MQARLPLPRNVSAILVLLFAIAATAETEIHKCTDEDGGIVYSQLPCAPPKPQTADAEESAEGEAEDAAPLIEDEFIVFQADERPARTEEEVAACKKRYRDQIDAIDLEIQREYAQEKADDYKRRLLQLTRQLRQC